MDFYNEERSISKEKDERKTGEKKVDRQQKGRLIFD